MTKKQEQTLDVFEEAIHDENKTYNDKRKKIEAAIASIEQYHNPYDPNGDVEDRNEKNSLENELRSLNQKHAQTVESLTGETKQK